jgi:hypothetical protein
MEVARAGGRVGGRPKGLTKKSKEVASLVATCIKVKNIRQSRFVSSSDSFASGAITKANGDYSTAMGFGTLASGQNSTAFGNWTTARGDRSTAIGSSVKAEHNGSFIVGDNSNCLGCTYNTTASNQMMMHFAGGIFCIPATPDRITSHPEYSSNPMLMHGQ